MKIISKRVQSLFLIILSLIPIFIAFTTFNILIRFYYSHFFLYFVKPYSFWLKIIAVLSLFNILLAFIYILKLKPQWLSLVQIFFRKSKKLHIYLIIYLIIYSFTIIGIDWYMHVNLNTSLFDLGVEEQVIYNTANGIFFGSGPEESNYLSLHFSPILIFVAFFYKIFPSVITLFIIQTLAVTFSAYAIYKISKLLLVNEGLSVMWSVIFTLHYGVLGPLLFDFHEVLLAMPFLLWGIYFFISNKKLLFIYLMFFLASLCQEEVNIIIFMLGLYWTIFERKVKALPLMLYGILMSVLTFFIFIPLARHGEASKLILRYSYWGTTPLEIIKNILVNPLKLIRYILINYKISYLLKLFLPVGFVVLFAPVACLIFIPNLLLNLLSNGTLDTTGVLHYEVLIVVGIFYTAILGNKKFIEHVERIGNNKYVIYGISIFSIIAINCFMFVGNPGIQRVVSTKNRSLDYQYIQNLKRKILPEDIVSVSNDVGAQFGDRKQDTLQLFDTYLIMYKKDPKYIIWDKTQPSNFDVKNRIQYFMQKGYKVCDENATFLVLISESK